MSRRAIPALGVNHLDAVPLCCKAARATINKAFMSLDPGLAKIDISIEGYVDILAPLESYFVHDPKTDEFLRLMKSVWRA